MNSSSPKEIADLTIEKGMEKASASPLSVCALGFLGGAFIALGYLAYVRVTGMAPAEWGSIVGLLGASVFPIGLILILLGGGELLTGNMMAISMAVFAKKVKFRALVKNWSLVALFNFIGAIFVAFLFGHFLGLTEGAYMETTVGIAEAKIADPFWQAFVSGIGCNWLVGMAVWLSYGTKDFVGKIIAIWFPTMIFVLIGFQHVVANMFIIPAAIFAGHLGWSDFLTNVVPVFLGNATGGSILVSLIYFVAYKREEYNKKGITLVKKSKIG